MKYLLIFLNIFALLNAKELTDETLPIHFREPYDQYIGSVEGIFSLKSEFKDSNNIFSDTDIEQKTAFNMQLQGSIEYKMICRLWRGEEKRINLVCDMEQGL